jgi:selenide,water dikinase
MLADLPRSTDPALLIGTETSDDAAVYRISDDLALIQTVDFFPPMVDDPYTFGQIAAANALSDVYAMGGVPKLAINLLCFPVNTLPLTAVRAILQGGLDKVIEAGASLCGGHSIEDKEPKYGLAVTGFAHPSKILSNAAAREGDLLLFTKPLGSGILTTAAKAELLAPADYELLIRMLTTLNAKSQQSASAFDVHACTDVTGFGLVGHAGEMAQGSGKTIELWANELPIFPAALEFARMGIVPAGAYRNREYQEQTAYISPSIPLERTDVLFDPQTSGGLLFAIAEKDAPSLLHALQEHSEWARIIGQVCARGEKDIIVK